MFVRVLSEFRGDVLLVRWGKKRGEINLLFFIHLLFFVD